MSHAGRQPRATGGQHRRAQPGFRPVAHRRVAVGGRRPGLRPPAAVPRHQRRGADQALFGNPAPASALARGHAAVRCHRAGARAPAPAARARRLHDRHHRTQRAPVAQGGARPAGDRASRRSVSLLFESFAYKNGVPGDADFVFDARCLPNPHWDARLRPLSGRDARGPRIPRRAGRASTTTLARSRPSSTPGCRASNRKPAATSPSPSAARAAGTARSIWRKTGPAFPRTRTARTC